MKVSVLIPTYNRQAALAVTLAGLAGQTFRDLEVIISDQSDVPAGQDQVIRTLVHLLGVHQCPVQLLRNLPRRGLAHQRQFLLDHAAGTWPDTIERMVMALREEEAGFCGMALIGLSYLEDIRPGQ